MSSWDPSCQGSRVGLGWVVSGCVKLGQAWSRRVKAVASGYVWFCYVKLWFAMAVKSSRGQSSSGVLCQVKAVQSSQVLSGYVGLCQVKAVVSGLDVVRCVESCRAKAVEVGWVRLGWVLSSYVTSSLVLSRQSCWVWLRSVKLRCVMLSQVMALHLPPLSLSRRLLTKCHRAVMFFCICDISVVCLTDST